MSREREAIGAALGLLAKAQAAHIADSFPVSRYVPEAQDLLRAVFDAPAAPQGEPVAWRAHVERRIRSWRRRASGNSEYTPALADFMGRESIDDLVQFVCDECATQQPAAPSVPAGWRTEAAAWLYRKAEEAIPAAKGTGWANSAHYKPDIFRRLAEELDAEQGAAPYGDDAAPEAPSGDGEAK